MSKFTIFFAAPITWFFTLIAVQNILIVVLYKYWKTDTALYKIRLAFCIMFSFILFIITAAVFQSLSANVNRESKVDVSPIAELSNREMGHLIDTLGRLREDDSIRGYRVEEQRDGGHLKETHNFMWVRGDEFIHVMVRIFDTEQGAIAFSSSESLYRLNAPAPYRSDVGKFTFLFFENGAEIRLRDSDVQKTFGDLGIAKSWRNVNTSMRLQNIRISMTERRHYLDLDNNITSDFIKILCEMLKEEEFN